MILCGFRVPHASIQALRRSHLRKDIKVQHAYYDLGRQVEQMKGAWPILLPRDGYKQQPISD